MATNYLGKPPKSWVIPVTRDCDRVFTMRRKDAAGDPVDWDADVYIDIDIDKSSPTRVEAAVVDNEASFVLQSTVCDLVKNTTKWRVAMSRDGIETPLAIGTFERHDG